MNKVLRFCAFGSAAFATRTLKASKTACNDQACLSAGAAMKPSVSRFPESCTPLLGLVPDPKSTCSQTQ